MRILLPCDHKWRDLINVCAMKVYLERLGHDVTVCTDKEKLALLPAVRPDCVIFGHMHGSLQVDIARRMKELGIYIVVLPTEGSPQPFFRDTLIKKTDLGQVDLYLSWSVAITDEMLKNGVVTPDKVVDIGTTRFDIYADPFRELVARREETCGRLGLDPGRPIVTWPSRFPRAVYGLKPHLFKKMEASFEDHGNGDLVRQAGREIGEVNATEARLRDSFRDDILWLSRELPEFQFLIKSHPAEDIDYYDDITAQRYPNVRMSIGDFICNVIGASDLVLTQQCTTTVDAWMMGVPTIENLCDYDPDFRRKEYERGGWTVFDRDELKKAVTTLVEQPDAHQDRAYQRQFLDRWYTLPDGRRWEAASQVINERLRIHGGARYSKRAALRHFSSPRNVLAAQVRQRFGLPADTVLRSVLTGHRKRTTTQFYHDKLATPADVKAWLHRLAPVIDDQLRRHAGTTCPLEPARLRSGEAA